MQSVRSLLSNLINSLGWENDFQNRRQNKAATQRRRWKTIRPDANLESRVMLSSFVDANSDGNFNLLDGDVELINGELDDGVFDTALAEGGYGAVIVGSSLVVDESITSKKDISLKAFGNVTIVQNLQTTKSIVIEARDGNINIGSGLVKADKSVTLIATESVNIGGLATTNIEVGKDFIVQNVGYIDFHNLNIKKVGKSTGNLVISALLGDIFMDEMSITGNFITNIASATNAPGGFSGIYFQDVTINTPGKSSTLTIKGALELTFNGDNIFNVGKSIDIESAGFSGQAKLIQTLAKNSTVRINFTFNNPLNFNPVAKDIRSHKEITINAGSVDLNLDNSTIAILDGSKKGVINITIPNATIQNTVLAAPFSLVISGNSTGTETFLGTGTRPAVPVV